MSLISALRNADAMPEGAYVEDVWTTAKIAIDMSGMMDGNIVYMESYYNEELSKWLNVDKSNMPPTYTLSNKVYMVKLKDGTYAAVRLTNYMNASGVKGFMTIDYFFFFQAEDGIRDFCLSRGLGDVYKRQETNILTI